uniref:Uncharacterized protein n=1 Tax=Rhizophora mucronata TaxID=61149 RepID=A0A2P2ISD9_RHIMU
MEFEFVIRNLPGHRCCSTTGLEFSARSAPLAGMGVAFLLSGVHFLTLIGEGAGFALLT